MRKHTYVKILQISSREVFPRSLTLYCDIYKTRLLLIIGGNYIGKDMHALCNLLGISLNVQSEAAALIKEGEEIEGEKLFYLKNLVSKMRRMPIAIIDYNESYCPDEFVEQAEYSIEGVVCDLALYAKDVDSITHLPNGKSYSDSWVKDQVERVFERVAQAVN